MRSGLKVGCIDVGLLSVAVLDVGFVMMLHAKVSGLPSGSLLALPSSLTVLLTIAVWSGPEFATGGWFAGFAVILTVSNVVLCSPRLSVTLRAKTNSGPSVGLAFVLP